MGVSRLLGHLFFIFVPNFRESQGLVFDSSTIGLEDKR